MLSVILELCLSVISCLPKFVSWWLYSPKRTKRNTKVSISANEGSVEFYCDKYNAAFNIWLEFDNQNPFPIEIDRIELSGNVHSASVKAFEFLGARIKEKKQYRFWLRGKFDEATLEQINAAPDNATLRLEIRALILNKHYHIRDFTCSFDRLMCTFHNKKSRVTEPSSRVGSN
jgi:hypothetical protein